MQASYIVLIYAKYVRLEMCCSFTTSPCNNNFLHVKCGRFKAADK